MLVLTAHVLAMDPASWRIVLGEFDAGLHALAAGRTASAGARAHQLPAVVAALTERARALDTEDFWAAELDGADPPWAPEGCGRRPTGSVIWRSASRPATPT